MSTTTSAEPASTARDIEHGYLQVLASLPRFDAARELEFAQGVVAARRALWSCLLCTAHRVAVLAAIATHAKNEDVRARAKELQGSDAALDELADALVRIGDEHAAANAVVALAAEFDAAWHREVLRARDRFLAARNRFVAANLRLVVHFAKRHGRGRMSLGDRIQEGNLGLMKAVDRFDPERGVRFSTYAAWWVRHAIFRALGSGTQTVRIPAQIHQIVARAQKAGDGLRVVLGREPELRELALATDCDPERLASAMRAMATRSMTLDASDDDGHGPSAIDSVCDPRSLAELEDVVDRHDRRLAVEGLAKLSAREREIVSERFALPGAGVESFEELGRRHGISRERARQVQRIALERLRRTLEPRPTLPRYDVQ